jgi:hypothetical protein
MKEDAFLLLLQSVDPLSSHRIALENAQKLLLFYGLFAAAVADDGKHRRTSEKKKIERSFARDRMESQLASRVTTNAVRWAWKIVI